MSGNSSKKYWQYSVQTSEFSTSPKIAIALTLGHPAASVSLRSRAELLRLLDSNAGVLVAKERVERDEEDLVRLYLTDIGQYPLLTKDDEVRLAQLIEKGAAARADSTQTKNPRRLANVSSDGTFVPATMLSAPSSSPTFVLLYRSPKSTRLRVSPCST